MWSFRRPGGSGMEQASSDAMAVRFALPVLHSTLSFLGRLKPFFSFWKGKKRMGSKTLPVCAERRQPPLGKGAFEWTESSAPAGVKVNFKSCKRADEYPRGAGRICNAPSSRTAALGIGPYKVRREVELRGFTARNNRPREAQSPVHPARRGCRPPHFGG